MFRVRAVNANGMSRASRASEPVAAMDPADRARKRGEGTDRGRRIFKCFNYSEKVK